MFLNKIDVPYCLVVFFVVCPRLRPFWSVFGELALFWCSTAKRKTRQNSDFRSVRRSRRIIPLENYPRPQFLQKFKAEMLQFHVHSLDSQFLPQIVHERCFYLLLDRLPNFELRCRLVQTAVDRFIDRIVCRVTKISPGRVASGLQSTNRFVLTTGLFVDCRPLATLAGLILVTRHADGPNMQGRNSCP